MLADKPDVVILELGANDALRGLPPEEARKNLETIILRLKESGAEILLAGMLAPRNLGPEYGTAFDAIYPDLAKAHNLDLYPFFLDGVATRPELNQGDGLHSTKEGVAVTVEAVANVKIAGDDVSLRGAAERFLGMSTDQIKGVIFQTLEGHLRAILGTLTVEEINADRQAITTP